MRPRVGMEAVEKREALPRSGIEPRPSISKPVSIPTEIYRKRHYHFTCFVLKIINNLILIIKLKRKMRKIVSH
jgi:hypothetical protein